ncbi:MAG: sporulation integral membrane protein YtvI [Clostridia bacterium]|nr:sporulation integral membrane protein YtvI [Clostridia bacterium]
MSGLGDGKIDFKKYAAIAICIGGTLAVLYFFGKYALGLFSPFLIGYGIAFMGVRLSEKIRRHFRIKRFGRTFAAVTVSAILAIIGFGAYASIHRLVYEGSRFINELSDEGTIEGFVNGAVEWGNRFIRGLPFSSAIMDGEQLSERIGGAISGLLQNAVERLGGKLTSFVGGIISGLPSLILFVTVTLISCYYFCFELDRVNAAIFKSLPRGIKKAVPDLRDRVSGVAMGYIKAYFTLYVITAASLTVGLMVLGVRYAFILAIIIATVDLLPVLGIGVIMIPWGVIALLRHDTFLGVGLLILFVLISITRQVLEPRILGKRLGIHPLITLITMYIGFKLFGIIGMISGPLVATVLSAVLSSKKRVGASDGDPLS